MNRIDNKFEQLQKEMKTAKIDSFVAGLDTATATKENVLKAFAAGTSLAKIIAPFCDPVWDTPLIQKASREAVKNGSGVRESLELVKEIRRSGCAEPILFSVYFQQVAHWGLKSFVEACIEAGVDGLLIQDLPNEEQPQLLVHLLTKGAPYLIQQVTPSSRDRIPMILEYAKGFICCKTDVDMDMQEESIFLQTYLFAVRAVSKIPLVLDFDSLSMEEAKPYLDDVDGVVLLPDCRL